MSAESYSLSVAPRDPGPAPVLGVSAVTLEPGKSANVPVSFAATGLAPGQYEGFVKISGTNSAVEGRAPYWYAVASTVPAHISPLSVKDEAQAGSRVSDAFYFRVTDASGIVLPNSQPTVTVVSGGGSVISTTSLDRQYPGVFSATVRLGATRGDNVFRIAAGDVEPVDITITGN